MDKKIIAVKKYRVMRGFSWLNIFIYLYTFISVLSANVALFSDTIKPLLFFNIVYLYFFMWCLLPLIIIILAYYIGYFDELKGIWKYENDFQIELTPKLNNMIDDLK